jgi:UDP-N-acetylmuramoylalanine--D-glutamate ligase
MSVTALSIPCPDPHGAALHTVILGLGTTGLSCARFLARHGIPFAVMDSRENPPNAEQFRRDFPEVPLVLGRLEPDLCKKAARLLVSPGVPVTEAAVQAARARGVEVIGDIELFAQQISAPVIAITGANGKSTVTTLVGEMAKAAGFETRIGGNLGTAALDLLGTRDPELYVLELSSFQLETTASLNAAAAVVLNLSPDHMDRYATMQDYADAKRRIYRGDGQAIVNADDPWVMAMTPADRSAIRFTLGEPGTNDYGIIQRDGGTWLANGRETLLPVAEMKLQGWHNIANALAALALGDAVGLERAAMLETLRRFGGLPHRCQWVASGGGVDWYNDSKGTNVGATCAALAGLGRDRLLVLIAGGDGKCQDFAPLAQAAHGRLRAAVVIGRDGPQVAAALAPVTPVIAAHSLPEAVRIAAAQAMPGDAVLLSPACASLDMFKNYVERGEVFVNAVREVLGS